MVSRYLALTDLRVLLRVVPREVLPPDVVQLVVADYMATTDVDTSAWEAKEFDAVRDESDDA